MLLEVAVFELRYQLRGPVFRAASVLFLLLSAGSIASPYINIDAGGGIHKNAPTSIIATCFMLSLFFTFVVTAIAANVIVRDNETGFGALIHTTRIGRSNYIFGRAIGAFAACALAFATVPMGIYLGTLAPWVDPATLGPDRLAHYAFAYGVVALPTIFLLVAFFASVATLTRSVMASYLAALGLLVVYLGATFMSGQGEVLALLYSWMEPFGNAAIRDATHYWTTDESNRALPRLGGALLGNRVLCLAMGVAWLLVARRFLRHGPVNARALPKSPVADQPRSGFALQTTTALPIGQSAVSVLALRTRFEVRHVVTSPAYLVLLALALVLTVVSVVNAGERFGTPIYPVTRVMISSAGAGFSLFAIVIAVFFSGELVWRERTYRIHEIVDATPMPNWAYVVPKTLALAAVLLSTLSISVLTDLAVQSVKGYTDFELDKYLLWYVLPQSANWFLLAALAVFVQAVSPSKYFGWGVMLIYLIATLVMAQLGFDHVLYNFNSSPPFPLSDMNGAGRFWIAWLWLKLYWAAAALALLVVSHLLWRRGASNLSARLRAAPRALKGSAGIILGGALLALAVFGIFIFYNTNVLNEYRTKSQENEADAAFERTFSPLVSAPQPAIAAVVLAVDLFPRAQRFEVRGTYMLVNGTGAPIEQVYLRIPEALEVQTLDIENAHLVQDYLPFNVRAYQFDTPMAAGQRRAMRFVASRTPRGFSNAGVTSPVVGNGTFLRNADLAPIIGVGDAVRMGDPKLRREYGLPPIRRMHSLDDPDARDRNLLAADWTTLDLTVSTDGDQVPLAPGVKVTDVKHAGRRTVRFVSRGPVLNFFSVQSARYAERHEQHAGVDLAVYFHPAHAANVARMLQAMSISMDYYQSNFGPYQFSQANIIEFPAYGDFAQSFPGSIAYSEGVGFIADVRDPLRIDYITYITAHELAHQWWAHQIIGADQQGTTVLNETLAQYSALMVMEKRYGPAQIRKFLRYESDAYLKGRRGQQQPEMPLIRVEKQGYVHYNKGSLVMYLLKDRLGEAAVNQALRSVLTTYRFKGPPYPSSADLVTALRAVAAPAEQNLITDLFERITILDLRASDPIVERRPDNRYVVSFTVEAHKHYAGGDGAETEAPFAERIDVGVFTTGPDEPGFGQDSVLKLGLEEIHSGTQRMHVVVDQAPRYVGVDPYNKWIDRSADDNLVAVTKIK